ncbi:type II toxin-antitoxin system Phd/YefM family antitoxin [Sphingomonas endolithica]|uniref:type II toxin-antitoxin system Phd/YefM family antitoxin n=1 Tax=Sphingomonas endolithica TaxID=2972485 RepID=UPI0021AF304B|nr:type II toxin-antitoxin system Phd/YefM family antitoxin [Sphingomonas sp. ZFBP2030]
MKVMSSREFNQDVSQAKRAARLAPVFVTDRGKPTHVLLSINAFRRLSGERETIVDLLAMRDDVGDTVGATQDATPWNGVP